MVIISWRYRYLTSFAFEPVASQYNWLQKCLDQVLHGLKVQHLEFWELDLEGAEMYLKEKRIKTI